eukprot:GHVS01014426.1.p1 GENE.GHVS01014426.1~~GHVS01014426.1.p1  ORF type:complete len:656 (+),score=81.95 GHVS01014426.1:138-2105(+)
MKFGKYLRYEGLRNRKLHFINFKLLKRNVKQLHQAVIQSAGSLQLGESVKPNPGDQKEQAKTKEAPSFFEQSVLLHDQFFCEDASTAVSPPPPSSCGVRECRGTQLPVDVGSELDGMDSDFYRLLRQELESVDKSYHADIQELQVMVGHLRYLFSRTSFDVSDLPVQLTQCRDFEELADWLYRKATASPEQTLVEPPIVGTTEEDANLKSGEALHIPVCSLDVDLSGAGGDGCASHAGLSLSRSLTNSSLSSSPTSSPSGTFSPELSVPDGATDFSFPSIPPAESASIHCLYECCRSICELISRCQQLRRYVLYNSIAVVKILKKRQKHYLEVLYSHSCTANDATKQSSAVLSEQDWYKSPVLAHILSEADNIRDDFLLAVTSMPPNAEHYSCSICLEVIVDPVSITACCHRFCWKCLTQAVSNAQIDGDLERCPYCRTAFALSPESFVVDYGLNKFLSRHFACAVAANPFGRVTTSQKGDVDRSLVDSAAVEVALTIASLSPTLGSICSGTLLKTLLAVSQHTGSGHCSVLSREHAAIESGGPSPRCPNLASGDGQLDEADSAGGYASEFIGGRSKGDDHPHSDIVPCSTEIKSPAISLPPAMIARAPVPHVMSPCSMPSISCSSSPITPFALSPKQFQPGAPFGLHDMSPVVI